MFEQLYEEKHEFGMDVLKIILALMLVAIPVILTGWEWAPMFVFLLAFFVGLPSILSAYYYRYERARR